MDGARKQLGKSVMNLLAKKKNYGELETNLWKQLRGNRGIYDKRRRETYKTDWAEIINYFHLILVSITVSSIQSFSKFLSSFH